MDRNARACVYTSMLLMFIGFAVICVCLSIAITYTVEINPSNSTQEVINGTNKFLNALKGNSPEQSLLILLSSFLAFGLTVAFIGLCILCCVNCGTAVGPEQDKNEYTNGGRRE